MYRGISHGIVSGHSHVPKIATVGGVLYLNRGSAAAGVSDFRSRWFPMLQIRVYDAIAQSRHDLPV
jgi:predicted phosphodiesterase